MIKLIYKLETHTYTHMHAHTITTTTTNNNKSIANIFHVSLTSEFLQVYYTCDLELSCMFLAHKHPKYFIILDLILLFYFTLYA